MRTASRSKNKPNPMLGALFNQGAASIFFQRLVLDSLARSLGRTPKKARIQKARVGGLKAEIIRGWAHEDGRTLLYLHGGAYMMGSIATHRPLASVLSRLSQSRGVLVDYRLAPEHPFPAALEDALDAYMAILSMGTPPEKVAVAGDSAGGGLTLCLLLAPKSKGLPMPAAALCMSPWTDLANSRKSGQIRRTGVPHRQDLYVGYVARLYAGRTDRKNPLVSPVYGDYAGLPPLLIQAARGELLRDDAKRTAERAQAHGVDVTLHVYDSRIHVLQGLAGRSELGRDLILEGGQFLKRHLEGGKD